MKLYFKYFKWERCLYFQNEGSSGYDFFKIIINYIDSFINVNDKINEAKFQIEKNERKKIYKLFKFNLSKYNDDTTRVLEIKIIALINKFLDIN